MTRPFKILMYVLPVLSAFFAMANPPSISDVVVRQRWPWSRLVDIDYVLTCDATQRVDVVLTARDGSMPLALSADTLTGDLYNVAPGARRIVWDPMRSSYTNTMLTQFSVTLTPVPLPLYLILDLTKVPGEVGQLEYVYESDLVNGVYGAVATNPVNGITSIVWTGVTNDLAYKDLKLVMRRIPAGSVTDQENNTTLTIHKDFYMAVFETTQNQWRRITGAYPSCKFGAKNGPVERSASYETLRGRVSEGIDWPASGSCVGTNSFIAAVREKTGQDTIDLPDNIQWQYACRAGATTIFNDNDPTATTATVSGTNSWMEALGCYSGNAGGSTKIVGSFKPNAWGLYDMHGNVLEWTLNLSPGSDTQRTRRGGSHMYEPARCKASFANGTNPDDGDGYGMNGFRLILNLY